MIKGENNGALLPAPGAPMPEGKRKEGKKKKTHNRRGRLADAGRAAVAGRPAPAPARGWALICREAM